MTSRLPVQIDPIRLADEGIRLQGELSGSELPRWRAFSVPGSEAEPVVVDLQFERAAQGARRMQGTIHGRVEMLCQRCLRPMSVAISAKPFLGLVPADAAEEADEAETLRVTAPIKLAELVEDELLLAMPMIPVHAEADCIALAKADAVPEHEAKENPFAVLQGLNKAGQHKT